MDSTAAFNPTALYLLTLGMLGGLTAGILLYGRKLRDLFGRKGALFIYGTQVLLVLHANTTAAMARASSAFAAAGDFAKVLEISTGCLLGMLAALVVGNSAEWVAKKFGKEKVPE